MQFHIKINFLKPATHGFHTLNKVLTYYTILAKMCGVKLEGSYTSCFLDSIVWETMDFRISVLFLVINYHAITIIAIKHYDYVFFSNQKSCFLVEHQGSHWTPPLLNINFRPPTIRVNLSSNIRTVLLAVKPYMSICPSASLPWSEMEMGFQIFWLLIVKL